MFLDETVDIVSLFFTMGDETTQELLADLSLSTTDAMKMPAAIVKKIEAINNPSFQQLSTMISQEIPKGTQSTQAAATQASAGAMSQSISRKAFVHYVRRK